MNKTTPLGFAAALAFVALCAGCGGAVGCDFREGSVNGPEDRCQERSGLGAAAFAATCEGLSGVVDDGGCSREEAVAECNTGVQGDGSAVIDVYYAPLTVDEARDACADGELSVL